jgi:hypothetical protein
MRLLRQWSHEAGIKEGPLFVRVLGPTTVGSFYHAPSRQHDPAEGRKVDRTGDYRVTKNLRPFRQAWGSAGFAGTQYGFAISHASQPMARHPHANALRQEGIGLTRRNGESCEEPRPRLMQASHMGEPHAGERPDTTSGPVRERGGRNGR